MWEMQDYFIWFRWEHVGVSLKIGGVTVVWQQVSLSAALGHVLLSKLGTEFPCFLSHKEGRLNWVCTHTSDHPQCVPYCPWKGEPIRKRAGAPSAGYTRMRGQGWLLICTCLLWEAGIRAQAWTASHQAVWILESLWTWSFAVFKGSKRCKQQHLIFAGCLPCTGRITCSILVNPHNHPKVDTIITF